MFFRKSVFKECLLVLAGMLCSSGRTSCSQSTGPIAPVQPSPLIGVSFEVATIKIVPPDTDVHWGFRSIPGGRVEIGGITVKELISDAFHVPQSQVVGGPGWIETDVYAVQAVPPDTSPSRLEGPHFERTTPTAEQRVMLQSLLTKRFGLSTHIEQRKGVQYVLTRGPDALKLAPPSDADRRPAFVMFMRGTEFDGETRGANVSMKQVAEELSVDMGVPVSDSTGLTASYDFQVEAFATDNHDAAFAAAGAMRRLGMRLRKVRGPVETIVIDAIQKPTSN